MKQKSQLLGSISMPYNFEIKGTTKVQKPRPTERTALVILDGGHQAEVLLDRKGNNLTGVVKYGAEEIIIEANSVGALFNKLEREVEKAEVEAESTWQTTKVSLDLPGFPPLKELKESQKATRKKPGTAAETLSETGMGVLGLRDIIPASNALVEVEASTLAS